MWYIYNEILLSHKKNEMMPSAVIWVGLELEKTLGCPFDCKEIQPVHSKGDQSRMFTGRTDAKAEAPILWPPHVKR